MAGRYLSVDAVKTYIGSFTWGPLVQLSRAAVLAVLQKIEVGQLDITDSNGTVVRCGAQVDGDEGPRSQLKVLNEAFWVRTLLFADMVQLYRHECQPSGHLIMRVSRVLLKVSCSVNSPAQT